MAPEERPDELKRRISALEAELDSVRQELHAAREKQRRGDEVFRRFSDSGLIGIALFELSGKILFGNVAFMTMIGRSAEEIAAGGVRWEELTTPEWRSRATEALEELQRRGSCAPYEAECGRPDGTRFWGLFTTVATEEQQAAAFVLDVTKRKRSEARVVFLAEASRILASSLDYQTTLDQVARLTVPLLADWCDIQVLDEAGAIRRVAVVHADPARVALADELDRRYPVDPESPRGVPHVLRSGEPEIYREIPDELLVAGTRDAEHLRMIRELGLRSALVMPLHPQAGTRRGRTLGAITLVYAESGRRYADEEIALAEDLARRAGMAVDNARLYAEAQAAVRRHQTVEARLTLLTEATGALIASLHLDRVLAEILRLSRRLIAADAYAIWRLDPAAGRWSIAAAEGLSPEYQSAAAQALRHSQPAPHTPMVVEEIDQEPLLAQHRHLLRQEGICSMLVSPLQTQGTVSGTLVFYYRQPHPFDEIERKVASALANLAASAIATSELYEAANQRAEQLVEADRLKDQFLAMLAHELRNPLGAITNAAYVLRRVQERGPAEDSHPTDQRAREIVERQSRHMARLVDQLLDVSRVSRGKIEIHPQRLDLTQLVRDTVEDHRPTLEAAALSLTLEVPDHPLPMEGDPTRLRQAVGNLLQNAAKFTPSGGRVTVGCRGWGVGGRVPASGPTPYTPPPTPSAVVTVADTGIGVPPELLPRLFDPFVQADRSLDRSRGGLGLGLALVKAIVELHGGTVTAESPGPGRGATFTLTLPILDFGFWILDCSDRAQATKPGTPLTLPDNPKSKIQNPKSVKVLVIEDNPDAAEALRDLLELLEHPVEIALSGPDGVEKARQIAPDVVLCDLGLPGMDGYAVAAALRGDPATAGARLIALTGYGQEEDLRRSAEAGFDAHLTKPVSLDALKRHLAGNPEP